jgi:hypothetical protein
VNLPPNNSYRVTISISLLSKPLFTRFTLILSLNEWPPLKYEALINNFNEFVTRLLFFRVKARASLSSVELTNIHSIEIIDEASTLISIASN